MSPARKISSGGSVKMQRERGFTMIEVLVTFVILAVGVLGIVSLLTVSKSTEFEAVQRARAVTLADTLLEKIRANPAALASVYAPGDPNNPPVPILAAFDSFANRPSEPVPSCGTGASCGADDLATHDLWVWKGALVGAPVTVINGGVTESAVALNDVTGCVVFSPFEASDVNTGLVQILVQWQGLQESIDGVAADEIACGGADPGNDNRRRAVRVSTFTVDEADI